MLTGTRAFWKTFATVSISCASTNLLFLLFNAWALTAELLPILEKIMQSQLTLNCSIPRAIDVQLHQAKHMMYTDDYLNKPDDCEYTVEPFPTNGDRFSANELMKRNSPNGLSRHGFLSSAIAAGWHNKSAAVRPMSNHLACAMFT